MRGTMGRLVQTAFVALTTIATIECTMIASRAADKLTEQEAHAIGVSAYLYFYPVPIAN